MAKVCRHRHTSPLPHSPTAKSAQKRLKALHPRGEGTALRLAVILKRTLFLFTFLAHASLHSPGAAVALAIALLVVAAFRS